MDEVFDAYRKWLGIPPEEQPPHHYRLLGIAVYEDDPDVISNAADRQMAHVRTFQGGQRGAMSQAMLNELSAAKVCLLNAGTKREYDQRLRARLAPAPVPVAAVSAVGTPMAAPIARPVGRPVESRTPTPVAFERRPASAVAIDDPAPDADHMDSGVGMPVTIRARPRKRSSSSSALTAVGVIGVLLVLALGAALFSGGNDEKEREPASKGPGTKSPRDKKPAGSDKRASSDSNGSPVAHITPQPTPKSNPDKTKVMPTDTPSPPVKDQEKPPVPDKNPTKNPDKSKPEKTPEKSPPDETPKDPSEKPTEVVTIVPSAEPSKAVKRKPALPPKEASEKAYRIVRKELEEQLRAAATPEDRVDLAQQIMERGKAATDAATQVALYTLVRNLALQLAHPEMLCEAVDALDAAYEIDPYDLKRAGLDEIANFVTLTLDDQYELLRIADAVTRRAIAAERFDSAAALSRMAKGLASRVRSPKAFKEQPKLEDLVKSVDRTAADAAELDRLAKGFDQSQKRLEKDKADKAAALAVGKYLFIVRRDWDKSMPLLAQSADPHWKDAATLDLAGAKTPADMMNLGRTWNEAVVAGAARLAVLQRARHWYAKAASAAKDAEKTQATSEITKIDAAVAALGEPAPDAKPADDAQDKPEPAAPEAKKPDAPGDEKAFPE